MDETVKKVLGFLSLVVLPLAVTSLVANLLSYDGLFGLAWISTTLLIHLWQERK